MHLLTALLTSNDFIYGPLFFMALFMVYSVVANKYKDPVTKRLFMKAFYFKMLISLISSLIIIFYYRGGDSAMYYDSAVDLKNAVTDNSGNLWTILGTKSLNSDSPIASYFLNDNSIFPTWESAHSPSNFMVPRLGLPFGLLTDMSYLCMSMAFSFFAFGGSIRLYKFFIHYFPDYQKEVALATLFLPSMVFWSSSFLKDPICFGSVGYLIYGLFSIFIRRKKILTSLIWISISVLLLFYVKVYILLALLPAVMLWLFSEVNKAVENKTLRRILAIMTFSIGAGIAYLLINYVGSDDSVKMYRLDTFLETSQYNRDLYKGFSTREQGAYFTYETSNPVLLVLYGMVATLFRPFPWEISSPIVFLSVIESMMFLYFTVMLFYKKGLVGFFKGAFSHPVFIMCLIFSLIFAAAVGSSATNFGSISRYKIPCLPFYLLMILIMYRQAGLKYPAWFAKAIGYRPEQKTRYRKPIH